MKYECSPTDLIFTEGNIRTDKKSSIKCAVAKYGNGHKLELEDTLQVKGVHPLQGNNAMLYEKGRTIQTLAGGSGDYLVQGT